MYQLKKLSICIGIAAGCWDEGDSSVKSSDFPPPAAVIPDHIAMILAIVNEAQT